MNIIDCPGWPAYREVVADKFFNSIDTNSRVLEIGAGTGNFSEIILEKHPRYLEIVEPFDEWYQEIVKRFGSSPVTHIECSDIFDLFDSGQYHSNQFDVVVLFGVLYHLSSPFDLLEKIVNRINPRCILIDNPYTDSVHLHNEIINTPGNLQTGRKSVKLSFHLPVATVREAMENLGYKQTEFRAMNEFNVFSKEITQIWKFER